MADIKFPKKQEQRLIPKYLLEYATKLEEKHPDPSADWGGGSGSTYTAGTGIDITENVISVDNDVAMKTDIPDVSDFVTNTELSTTLEDYELKSEAFSGSYNDLSNKPDLSVYELKTDAFSGDYTDLTNKPDLSVYELKTDAFSGNYNDLTNKPDLSIYAQSANLGDCAYLDENELSIAYSQITGTPSIPTNTSDLNNDSGFITSSALSGYATETWVGNQGYLTSVSWSDVSNKPTFATVATSGDYDDLTNKPTIPTVPTNISAFTNDSGYITGIDSTMVTTALGYTPGTSNFSGDYDDLTDKPDLSIYAQSANLATVATTGAYSDLSGTPTIPTVNDPTITFTQGGVSKGTITLNQASNQTIALDAGSAPTNMVTTNTAQTITGAKTFTTNPLDIVNAQKGIKLHSGTNNSTNAKLGFTLFNSTAGSTANEVGFLESNTAPATNNGHSTLLGYYNTSRNTDYSNWDLGFAYNSYNTTKGHQIAYKLMVPNQYNLNAYNTKRYIPIDFTNGTNTVRSDATGIVDISTLLPTVPILETGTITTLSGVDRANNMYAYKYGKIATVTFNIRATSGTQDLLTLPWAPANVWSVSLAFGSTEARRALIDTTGKLYLDAALTGQGWFNATITYITE